MSGETANPIAVRQYLIWCVLFMFMLSAQPGCQPNKPRSYSRPTPFKWFEFERSLDNDLFYNVHRMDKASFYALHNAILLGESFLQKIVIE